mgnify:CR=1 FL=1
MNEASRLFWADVQGKLNTFFSGEEIETLAFVLGIDYDALRGGAKPTKINALLADAGRKGLLAPLLAWARRERPNVAWPDAPAGLELPTGEAEAGGATVYNINTGGGAYFGGPVSAEGDVGIGQKNVAGDEIRGSKYVMSGDFRGAILNIESRLDNVTQTLGAMPAAAPDQRAELARLVGELKAALAAVPQEAAPDATRVTKWVQSLAEEATADAPDAETVRDLGDSLKRAAGKLATAAPSVITLTAAIVELVAAILK